MVSYELLFEYFKPSCICPVWIDFNGSCTGSKSADVPDGLLSIQPSFVSIEKSLWPLFCKKRLIDSLQITEAIFQTSLNQKKSGINFTQFDYKASPLEVYDFVENSFTFSNILIYLKIQV